MSIERTLPTQPVATTGAVQPTMNDAKGLREPSASRTAGAEKQGTRVTLSEASRQMAGSGDVDMARVAQIKEAIARGELHFDAEKIADALLADNAFLSHPS